MGRHFPVKEILESLEKLGNITQNTGKFWGGILEISDKYYLLFLVIFKWTVYFLLKWIKFSVEKKQNLKKVLEESGKSGNHDTERGNSNS